MSVEWMKYCIPLLKGQIGMNLAYLRKQSSNCARASTPALWDPLSTFFTALSPAADPLDWIHRAHDASGFSLASGGTSRSPGSWGRELRVFFFRSILLAGPQLGRGYHLLVTFPCSSFPSVIKSFMKLAK